MKRYWPFYCPLCRSARRISFRPHPGKLRHFVQVGLSALVFMVATWRWFEWRGVVSFVPFWLIFEAVYRARCRGILNCTQCGFDPYLYLIDTRRARAEVESHWRKKFAEKGIPYPGDPIPQAAERPTEITP